MNPLSALLGPVFRAAMLAGVLFYGANVGRAAGNSSLMQPAPWISGAVSTAITGMEVGHSAAAQLPSLPAPPR